MPTLVAGVERYDAGLKARNLLTDAARANENSVFTCRHGALTTVPYPDVTLTDQASVTALRDALRRIALPQNKISAPMLVVNGLADQTIAAPWVTAAVTAACALGGPIRHVQVTGAGHGDLGKDAYQLIYRWIHDRFTSAPATSNCQQAPDQISVS